MLGRCQSSRLNVAGLLAGGLLFTAHIPACGNTCMITSGWSVKNASRE
ncbi:MAG: hypothetical protein NTY29_08060 [Proteobacteria bacterium]|nr:hypothetical protein [Pseudomonadota bacterium]